MHSSFSNSKISLKGTLFSRVLAKMLFHYSYISCVRQPHIQTNTKQALWVSALLAVPALPSCPTSAFTPSFQLWAPLLSSNLFPKQLPHTYPRSQSPCPAILNYAAAQSSPQVSLSLPTAKFCVPFHTWEQESHATEKKITMIFIVRKKFT